MTEAFTYCWTDHKTGKLYVGIHKGSNDDGYVCSGKSMLKEHNSRPGDFSRQIIASGAYQDMISLETAILKTVNAAGSDEYYNGHNGDGKFYNKGHTEETKRKLKIARNKRTDLPRLGVPLSEEGKKKASESAKNRYKTEEGKFHVSKAGKNTHKNMRDLDPIAYKEEQKRRAILGWQKRKGLI